MSAKPTDMTKEEALAAFGGSVSTLADALDISTSAVYQWEDGKFIPRDKALSIRFVLKPDFFGEAPRAKRKVA